MRMYNLNWHLKENQQATMAKHQFNNGIYLINDTIFNLIKRKLSWNVFLFKDRKSMPIIFSKIGDTIEDQIAPYEFFSVQLFLDQPAHVKFNVTFTKNANLGINFILDFFSLMSEVWNFNILKVFTLRKIHRQLILNSNFSRLLTEILWSLKIL